MPRTRQRCGASSANMRPKPRPRSIPCSTSWSVTRFATIATSSSPRKPTACRPSPSAQRSPPWPTRWARPAPAPTQNSCKTLSMRPARATALPTICAFGLAPFTRCCLANRRDRASGASLSSMASTTRALSSRGRSTASWCVLARWPHARPQVQHATRQAWPQEASAKPSPWPPSRSRWAGRSPAPAHDRLPSGTWQSSPHRQG